MQKQQLFQNLCVKPNEILQRGVIREAETGLQFTLHAHVESIHNIFPKNLYLFERALQKK